jgi:hypothetical protein
MSYRLARWRIALSTSVLSDLERAALVSGMQKVAPQSPLMQVPSIAASYSAITKKGATLTAASAAVAADEKQLKIDLGAREQARVALDVELLTMKTLVTANAQSAADILGMGFTPLTSAATGQTAVPDLPGPLVAIPGKVPGRARVGIDAPGRLAGSTAAEVSPDPVGANTWQPLPGSGKQRKLKGYASGTRLWVRFAPVRFGQQGAWCTPVLVTIP